MNNFESTYSMRKITWSKNVAYKKTQKRYLVRNITRPNTHGVTAC